MNAAVLICMIMVTLSCVNYVNAICGGRCVIDGDLQFGDIGGLKWCSCCFEECNEPDDDECDNFCDDECLQFGDNFCLDGDLGGEPPSEATPSDAEMDSNELSPSDSEGGGNNDGVDNGGRFTDTTEFIVIVACAAGVLLLCAVWALAANNARTSDDAGGAAVDGGSSEIYSNIPADPNEGEGMWATQMQTTMIDPTIDYSKPAQYDQLPVSPDQLTGTAELADAPEPAPRVRKKKTSKKLMKSAGPPDTPMPDTPVGDDDFGNLSLFKEAENGTLDFSNVGSAPAPPVRKKKSSKKMLKKNTTKSLKKKKTSKKALELNYAAPPLDEELGGQTAELADVALETTIE